MITRRLARRRAHLDFEAARISGDFSLHAPEIVQTEVIEDDSQLVAGKPLTPGDRARLEQTARRYCSWVAGDLRLSRAQVGGSVVLNGAQVSGAIDLRDTSIRANVECRPVELQDGGPPGRGRAERAQFEAMAAHGDVVLTGLTVVGDLDLRDASIVGRLELHPEGGAVTRLWVASIGGALLLNGAKASHAILSGLSFDGPAQVRQNWFRAAWARSDYLLLRSFFRGGRPDDDDEAHPPAKKVVLERATVGQLEIADPLPAAIDLSSLHVSNWKDRSNFFREMLACSYPFKQSCYRAIEKDLRNRGNDSEADEVYVLMRRRDRRYSRGAARIFGDWLLDASVKYGTTASRLSLVLLALFVLTAWSFRDPGRVEYRISPSAQKPSPPVEHPKAADWGASDATFLALRLHVPIVSLGVGDDVQPSGTRWQLYGMFVITASLVIWPLILASLSGLLRRRE